MYKSVQIQRRAGMTWPEVLKAEVIHGLGHRLVLRWGAMLPETGLTALSRRIYEWASSGRYRCWTALQDAGWWKDEAEGSR